jgi:type II secretory pathway pseudopilin PulG
MHRRKAYRSTANRNASNLDFVRVSNRVAAFTLLEVILAMSLTSILMLLVWSLFNTYTKLEERSSRAAVELQLVRSLTQQLRSDLEHFAVLPIPSAIPQTVKNQQGNNSQATNAEQSSNGEEFDEPSSSQPSETDSSNSDSEDSRNSDSRNSDSEQRDQQGATRQIPITAADSSPSPSRFPSSTRSSTASGGGEPATRQHPTQSLVKALR